MERFGFCKASWTKSVRAGRIKPRPLRKPLELILKSTARNTIKRRLLDAGILKNVCDECGISEWRGKRLAIQIDHVNGIRDDHRLENLRMLCPNCHSQTETFAARNRLRPKLRLA
jgi:5-methylcytosine-specific restriction endonuclease McrA